MNKLTIFSGLALLGAISLAPVPIQPFQEIAYAIDFKRFTPELRVNGNTATLVIPKDLMEAAFTQALKINEQRLKDTDFNRITLKRTRADIVGDKLRVSGDVQFEHRELIVRNPITGKRHYSPWVSVSGKVTQLFGIQIRDNKTVVRNIGAPKLEGLEGRWYALIVSEVGLYVGPRIAPKITQALSNFNGLDVRQFAINEGSPLLAAKLGINENIVKQTLQQNIGPINAGILGDSNFAISFSFPKF